ncbi:MAG: metallophosphoesterase family protein [Candidatus Hodarchaeales archaeon]
MAKILFVSDVHIGIRYSYRVDLRTGISARTLDFIDALSRVVNYAIENKIDIFVISGDLFDRVTVGPTLLRLVREKIWIPLIKSKIPIILVGGNHDSPQIVEKGSPFGEISIIPNSIAVRTPQIHEINTKYTEERIGFVLLPYMTATQAVSYVEKVMEEEIEREDQMKRSQELFRDLVKRYVERLDTEIKILVGHFYVQGSRIGIIPYPDQLPHEFVFKRDMIPLNKLDLAVFGHIHTSQRMFDNKLLVPGSLERVDFGETKEDKGFYIFDTSSLSLDFISNNPRPLIKLVIKVPKRTENPTDYIIKHISQNNINDAILRIYIRISSELKERIILRRIHPILEETTFHYEIDWDTSEKEREIILPQLILDPLALFSSFISEKYKDYPYLKELREKGLEILDEALSKVEDYK